MQKNRFCGLSTEEAQKLAQNGHLNILPTSREGGVGDILRRNILTLFNLLNLVLAVLLFIVGSYRNMLFLGVILSNILIGTVQELRAKRMHDRLKLLSEGKVRILRDDKEVALAPQALVLGDVTLLNRGDQIPADAEVLWGSAQVDESLLTGESLPVAKAEGAMLYSGSFLTEGSVSAKLTAVGADSYAGKLQLSARKVKHARSVLMKDMNQIIRAVSIAIVPIGLLLFWKQHTALGLPVADSITKTVASMLGMIPEGLILLTSVALAVGVVTLGRKKALVNTLYGIESLARTNVVCTDKTGTLTSGQMTLSQVIALNNTASDELASCLSAHLSSFSEQTPTNDALRAAYPTQAAITALQTISFSSERKWSASRFEGLGTVVLGAPEKLLTGDLEVQAKEYAAQGLRVLCVLKGSEELSGEELPGDLSPMALLCLSDSLRSNVQETVRYFEEQGVALKVISGDSPLTVSRVAQDAGVLNAEKLVDLSSLTAPIDYQQLSREYTVFGRVSPEDKQQLIKAYQHDGHSVAMIGDGVNDIPALKAADCSIAIAGGSDAASRIAQITLLNGNFDVMPSIVLEGRRVINNITRASSLFLVKNIFSFLLSILLLALPFAYPFAPIQLTLISTLTIGIPSFALALQPSHERVKGSFMKNIIIRALPGGLCVTILIVTLMLLAPAFSIAKDQLGTMCTLLAGYSGLMVLLLTCLPLNALRGVLVLLLSAGFVALVVLVPSIFYLVPIAGISDWVFVGCCALVPLIQIGLGAMIRGFEPHVKQEHTAA